MPRLRIGYLCYDYSYYLWMAGWYTLIFRSLFDQRIASMIWGDHAEGSYFIMLGLNFYFGLGEGRNR